MSGIFSCLLASGSETALSPILGLTLIQMVEYLGIVGLSVGIATAVILWIQIRRQRKVDSARFVVDYVNKILEDNKKVVDKLYEREKDDTVKFDTDKQVRILLNGFDNTVQFVNDGVIDKKQALNMMKITLLMLKKDTEVQRIIKETVEGTIERKAKPKAFDKVIELMNEID